MPRKELISIICGALLLCCFPVSILADLEKSTERSVIAKFSQLIAEPNERSFFDLMSVVYNVAPNVKDILFLRNRLNNNSIDFLTLNKSTEHEFSCTEAEVAVSCLEAHIPLGSVTTEIKGISSCITEDIPLRVHIYVLSRDQIDICERLVNAWIGGFIAGNDSRAKWEAINHPAIRAWCQLKIKPSYENMMNLIECVQGKYPDMETICFLEMRCFGEIINESDCFEIQSPNDTLSSREIAWSCLKSCLEVACRGTQCTQPELLATYDIYYLGNKTFPLEFKDDENFKKILRMWMKGYSDGLLCRETKDKTKGN